MLMLMLDEIEQVDVDVAVDVDVDVVDFVYCFAGNLQPLNLLVRLRLKTDARLVLVVGVGDERDLNRFYDERKLMKQTSRFAELMMNIRGLMSL